MSFRYQPWSSVKVKEVHEVKELGKHMGYCPNCNLMFAELELGKPCGRCGEILPTTGDGVI